MLHEFFYKHTHNFIHKYRCKHTGLPSLTEEESPILFKIKFLWCINTGAELYLEAFQEDPGFGIYDERDRPRRETESFDNEFLCLTFACLCLKRVGCCLWGHLQSEGKNLSLKESRRNSVFGGTECVLHCAVEHHTVKCFRNWSNLFTGLVVELQNVESWWPLAFIFPCNSRSSHILPSTSPRAQANKASIYVIILF